MLFKIFKQVVALKPVLADAAFSSVTCSASPELLSVAAPKDVTALRDVLGIVCTSQNRCATGQRRCKISFLPCHFGGFSKSVARTSPILMRAYRYAYRGMYRFAQFLNTSNQLSTSICPIYQQLFTAGYIDITDQVLDCQTVRLPDCAHCGILCEDHGHAPWGCDCTA